MKKALTLKLAALVIVMALVLSACTALTGSSVSDEKVCSDVQRLYRNASLIVIGKCVQNHIDENGAQCSDLVIDGVLAGTSKDGILIHCPGAAMKDGASYLMYLASDESATYYTEDALGYTLLTDAPIAIDDEGVITFNGVKISLTSIEADMKAQSAVITAPADSYYYKDINSLVEACDRIFIGRIKKMPEPTDTAFRMSGEGSVVENTLRACVLTVTAYGSIKGDTHYGDELNVIYCPSLCDDITDAATLKSLTYTCADATEPEQGGVYMFFLVRSPDGKQDYLFGVNGIQGFASLDTNDQVHVNYRNGALSGFFSLDLLVRAIRNAIA